MSNFLTPMQIMLENYDYLYVTLPHYSHTIIVIVSFWRQYISTFLHIIVNIVATFSISGYTVMQCYVTLSTAYSAKLCIPNDI